MAIAAAIMLMVFYDEPISNDQQSLESASQNGLLARLDDAPKEPAMMAKPQQPPRITSSIPEPLIDSQEAVEGIVIVPSESQAFAIEGSLELADGRSGGVSAEGLAQKREAITDAAEDAERAQQKISSQSQIATARRREETYRKQNAFAERSPVMKQDAAHPKARENIQTQKLAKSAHAAFGEAAGSHTGLAAGNGGSVVGSSFEITYQNAAPIPKTRVKRFRDRLEIRKEAVIDAPIAAKALMYQVGPSQPNLWPSAPFPEKAVPQEQHISDNVKKKRGALNIKFEWECEVSGNQIAIVQTQKYKIKTGWRPLLGDDIRQHWKDLNARYNKEWIAMKKHLTTWNRHRTDWIQQSESIRNRGLLGGQLKKALTDLSRVANIRETKFAHYNKSRKRLQEMIDDEVSEFDTLHTLWNQFAYQSIEYRVFFINGNQEVDIFKSVNVPLRSGGDNLLAQNAVNKVKNKHKADLDSLDKDVLNPKIKEFFEEQDLLKKYRQRVNSLALGRTPTTGKIPPIILANEPKSPVGSLAGLNPHASEAAMMIDRIAAGRKKSCQQ
ncbi:MAG: hypothetical protein QF408_03925 [Pirellulales bacterium]|nr:hypothetical protein [Pirellulales bacterium]